MIQYKRQRLSDPNAGHYRRSGRGAPRICSSHCASGQKGRAAAKLSGDQAGGNERFYYAKRKRTPRRRTAGSRRQPFPSITLTPMKRFWLGPNPPLICEHKNVREQLERCESEEASRRSALETASADKEQWDASWAEVCKSCWLGAGGTIPSLATVKEVMDRLAELGPAAQRQAGPADSHRQDGRRSGTRLARTCRHGCRTRIRATSRECPEPLGADVRKSGRGPRKRQKGNPSSLLSRIRVSKSGTWRRKSRFASDANLK